MADAKIHGRYIDYIDRLREIAASAHAIRCTCIPAAPDPRCQALQALGQDVPRDSSQEGG